MANRELEDVLLLDRLQTTRIFSSRTDWSGDGDIKVLVTSGTRQSIRTAPIPGLPALTPIASFLEPPEGLAGLDNSKPDRQALALLIHRTQRLVEKVEGEVVPIISAMAQRSSAQVKIANSIEVGMKRYWQGLASSGKFLGSKLEVCVATVHQEITDSWNFHDPKDVSVNILMRPAVIVTYIAKLLNGPEFVETIKALAQFVTPDAAEAGSWFGTVDHIQALLGFGAPILAATAGPAVAAIQLSMLFVKWLRDAYNATPESLRCFMGYIVDLTLVMDHLFLAVLSINPPRSLTKADISAAVEKYSGEDGHMSEVHREIRQYVNALTFPRIFQSDKAEEKVKELINRYCVKNEQDVSSPS
ncbi:hypothetical protein B0H11DRAFT_2270332 [Mycena galericulata]|nr:hypothetical protein B0H11DRAFT_2270332 [Mycena galericulata]